MNPTYHLSAEVGVALMIVVYFQFKMSCIRSDLDNHIKKYEADKQEIEQAINNLYEQLNLVRQQLRHNVSIPQEQQYAYPPQARAPQAPAQQNPQQTFPQGQQAYTQGPLPQQQPARSQQQRPMSPPPRGSREEFMGRAGASPQAGARQQPSGRQMPGMPANPNQPPPMSQQPYGSAKDDEGGGAYGTIDDEEEQNFYASGKKGSLKAMAASIEQARRSTLPTDMPRNQDM